MKIGRNDPCPCGSGKKYKQCCYGKTIISDQVNIEKALLPYKTGKTVHNEEAWISNNDRKSIYLPKQYIDEHYYPNYHIVFADYDRNECVYISNPICEIKDKISEIVGLVSSCEHTFIDNISVDKNQHIYFVQIDISQGYFNTRFQYCFNEFGLVRQALPVPEIVFADYYADTARQDIRCPVVDFSNDEISSLRNYEIAELRSVIGDGQLNNEIKLTEKCITKIEQCFNTNLVGERNNLRRCREQLENKSVFECARFFNVWRKGLVDAYSGKICTAERLNRYFGMDECVHDLPVFVLPDVEQLSTFYESVAKQFPVKKGMKGIIPFDNYVIKVSDKKGQVVYVVVHKKEDCFELVGLSATSNESSQSNLDFVALRPNSEMEYQYGIGLLRTGRSDNEDYSAPCIKVPFGYLEDFARYCKVWRQAERNHNGVKTNAFAYWNDIAIEYAYGDIDVAESMTNPSADVLLLHIWLHSLALYDVLLNTRHIESVKSSGLVIGKIDADRIKSTSNKCVIDLGKEKKIYIYENDEERDQICRKYHIFSTTRRGHLRHYKNGDIVYIPPQFIKYSNLADDAHEKNDGNAYRNSEDFIQEKSYLENDVDIMLRTHHVEYKREVSSATFPWIGRKRLDFFLPKQKIAIECQGVQHFYKYGGSDTIEDLEERKKRDLEKYQQCKNNGIVLIYYVSPNIPLPDWFADNYTYFTNINDLYEMIN